MSILTSGLTDRLTVALASVDQSFRLKISNQRLKKPQDYILTHKIEGLVRVVNIDSWLDSWGNSRFGFRQIVI